MVKDLDEEKQEAATIRAIEESNGLVQLAWNGAVATVTGHPLAIFKVLKRAAEILKENNEKDPGTIV